MTVQRIAPRATTAEPSRLLASEVRAELARRGVTVNQLALALRVNHMWLHRRIGPKADVDLSLETVQKIAEALDMPVERLLAAWLPRLDSNQEPSGYLSAQVIDLAARRAERVA